MAAQPVPLEVMTARVLNGKTLGGRDFEVIDASQLVAPRAPEPPEGLKARGTVEWVKIWKAGKWLWPDQDYVWVEQIARAHDDVEAFRKSLEDDGLMVRGSRPGQYVSNPIISEIRKAEETIRRCLSEIGFSPSARARLKYTEAKGATELQKLVNGGRGDQEACEREAFEYVEGEW